MTRAQSDFAKVESDRRSAEAAREIAFKAKDESEVRRRTVEEDVRKAQERLQVVEDQAKRTVASITEQEVRRGNVVAEYQRQKSV